MWKPVSSAQIFVSLVSRVVWERRGPEQGCIGFSNGHTQALVSHAPIGTQTKAQALFSDSRHLRGAVWVWHVSIHRVSVNPEVGTEAHSDLTYAC